MLRNQKVSSAFFAVLSLGAVVGLPALAQPCSPFTSTPTPPVLSVSDGSDCIAIDSNGTTVASNGTVSTAAVSGVPGSNSNVKWSGTLGTGFVISLNATANLTSPQIDVSLVRGAAGEGLGTNNGTTAGTITIEWSNTGFTGVGPTSTASESTGTSCSISPSPCIAGSASVVYQYYIDNNNNLFGTGTLVKTIPPSGSITMPGSSGPQTGPGPSPTGMFYSMTEVETITLPAGARVYDNVSSLSVTPTALALTCPASTSGQVGVLYSSSLVATGGVTPYTFSLTGGTTLPPGLTLTPSGLTAGLISGTPTMAGTFNFTAQVMDSSGNSATDTATSPCTITIIPQGTPVTVNCVSITAVQGMAITPVTLMAMGGTGMGYTFTATGLPPGLSISSSGTISGTPTMSGTFPYTVTVTDSGGNTGKVNCSVTVMPPPGVCTIPASSEIISNTSWNKFNIPSGTSPTLWVHAHFNSISGIPTNMTSTVLFSGVSFVLNGKSYAMPSGLVTFDPLAPAVSTTFYNSMLNQWQTLINPKDISDENFFVGTAIPVDATIAGGGTATIQFTTTASVKPISFSWQWSAAVFTFFPTDLNLALIQPYHGNGPTGSQHAGTPDNTKVQASLIQGPRGGGGSNFTGSWSATGQSGPCK